MSQIRLLLADKDLMYLEKFGSYLQRNKANRFSLELITSVQKLEEWFTEGGRADLAAISSSLFFELDKKPESKNIVILSDCPESLLPQGYISINKYRPAEMLMKEILSLCSENLPERTNEKGAYIRLELVLYADGSDVLNPIAQAMACLKAQEHKSVFYLNLDEISNTNAYFTGNNPKGLSEMLYYVKSQKENLALKAEACSSKDMASGVDFMSGHKNPEDIGRMTPSELDVLLNAIGSRGCYDEIIVSRAFLYDDLLQLLLKKSSKIYITGLDYPSSVDRLMKISNLISRLDDECGMELKNKVMFCIHGMDRELRTQNLNLLQFPFMFLPYSFDSAIPFFPPSGQYLSSLKSVLDS